MNGTWIKIQTSLLRSPKIVRMMSALDADKFRTLGGTVSAWCLADEHANSDGVLEMSTDELDALIGFPGLAAAMISVGWLLELPGSKIQFPDYEAHNGPTAKRRAQETSRKGRARKRTNVRIECGQMSASDADKVRNREEKRREDKIVVQGGTSTEERTGGAELEPPPFSQDVRNGSGNENDGDGDAGPADPSRAILCAEDAEPEGAVVAPPCTLSGAEEVCAMMGAGSACAALWFDESDSRGWRDKSGQPIRNWQASARAYARRWVENERSGFGRSQQDSKQSHSEIDESIGW